MIVPKNLDPKNRALEPKNLEPKLVSINRCFRSFALDPVFPFARPGLKNCWRFTSVFFGDHLFFWSLPVPWQENR